MTPQSSASSRMVTSLLTDRRLRSWLFGAVLTTWSSTRSKQWRWSWTSGETPCSPPTHHHEQHCDCSGVIQIPGHHHLPPSWDTHIVSIVKKAQLRKFNLPQELLIQFYSAIIESVLCTSITVWFSSATKSDLRRLQRVVRTAEWISGTTLPVSKNCTYPEWAKGLAKSLWTPHIQHTPSLNCLPSGRRYRALSTRTTRHRNSFFPQAIQLMNTWH